MKIAKPSIQVTFYLPENGNTTEQEIEKAARICYKSEDKISQDSDKKIISMLLNKNHNSMLEFGYATAHIICDRGISHELVRHRLASFAQESTRYCNYSKDKFNNEISFIEPPILNNDDKKIWDGLCKFSEKAYLELLKNGVSAQIARSVLPTCLKTELTIGANLREWRHILIQRCSKKAHPQMRELMIRALYDFYRKIPCLYEDIYNEYYEDFTL